MDILHGTYRHFKGEICEVVGVGRNSETLEQVVIYRALKDDDEFGKDALWVRPLTMFTESVTHEGKLVPRFKKLPR